MKKHKTSKAWLADHIHDPYVRRAQAEGYRSRAAYKLIEIDQRDKLLRPGMLVVDLGSAPGSWCQIAVKRLAGRGRVLALDMLPMEPLAGVEFLQGDFGDGAVLAEFDELIGQAKVDLVMSDMAPNLSGIAATDQARSVQLAELTLEFSRSRLAPNGRLLIKLFQGSGFEAFRASMEKSFRKVELRKPSASRDRSAEVYLLGSSLVR